jgi:hypothetical protein
VVHVLPHDGEWERHADMFETPQTGREPSRGADERIPYHQGPCRGLRDDDHDTGGHLQKDGRSNDKEGEVTSKHYVVG